MAKLTREQIKEGLSSIPMETLLMGREQAKETKLTAKQKAFAYQVAQGQSKAEAYRRAYNSKGKKKTQGDEGYRLTKNPVVNAEIQAIERAIEASKYQTPSQLRQLVIHQLTQHALDKDVPPAQRLKALQLLGNVSEVAAFTERREVLNLTQSSDIKNNLLSKLKQLTGIRDTIDITPSYIEDDLLSEIAGSKVDADYPTTTPPSDIGQVDGGMSTHTIPHKGLAEGTGV